MNTGMTEFMEETNVLNKKQIGFKKGSRTADHIFVLKTLIDIYKRKRQPIYSCFLDLRKAFDSVWRSGLFYKMLKYGVSKKFVCIVKDLYNKTKNRVFVNGFLSQTFVSEIGTRQGCILSPTIFTLFMNDLPRILRKGNCQPVELNGTKLNLLMYADDIILMSKTKAGLQRSLDICKQYLLKWKLRLNLQKSKIVIFNRKADENDTFYFGDDIMEIVSKYKYLGLYIDNKIGMKAASDDLLIKAKKAYGALYQSLNIYNGAKPRIILKAFDSMVVPILSYGSEIRTPYDIKVNIDKILENVTCAVEKFHNRVCKNVLGVRRCASNIACRAELGRYPFAINSIVNTFRYYLYLQDKPVDSLLGQALIAQNSMSQSNKKNIVSFLKSLCRDINHHLPYREECLGASKYKKAKLANLLKSKLMTLYSSTQKKLIVNNKKLEVLSMVKINVMLNLRIISTILEMLNKELH